MCANTVKRAEEADEEICQASRERAVVHVNINRRVEGRRCRSWMKVDACDLGGSTIAGNRLLRSGVHFRNRQDLGDRPRYATVAENHQNVSADAWIDEARIGN